MCFFLQILYAFHFTTNHPENLVKHTEGIIDKLSKKGYTLSRVRNTWLDDSNPYKGINTNLITPIGYEFELQFHTPESFAVKNGAMHELYEKQRELNPIKDADKIQQIDKEMFELSRSLKRPKDVEIIGED
ncbi:hypothetical protein CL176_01385 [Suicoccus acidiformans]|uniref:RelA/SpoT domain-containing protein n=1 Tax=Suicoccus acidiformans TaxID=2036206 RepID=A0A347WI67_9LACT|nr:hypothetical protein [Suicoccus acidiformans]AXY24774.1 hypothetical protein CL176_01385 [Suicoccus acidiformans]